MRKIEDDFSELRISRQRKYQLRMRRAGRCMKCGELAAGESKFCLKHLLWSRESRRERSGAKRRRRTTLSYQLEKAVDRAARRKIARLRAR